MKIEITHIKIITSDVADLVLLYTPFTEACYPYKARLDLEFKAAQGTGKIYCETNFPGVPIEVIKVINTDRKLD